MRDGSWGSAGTKQDQLGVLRAPQPACELVPLVRYLYCGCRWVGNKVILPPSALPLVRSFPILAFGHGTLRQYGSFGRGGIPSFLHGSIILFALVDLILNDPRTFFPNSTA